VAVRCRPLNSKEKSRGEKSIVNVIEKRHVIELEKVPVFLFSPS
jgi:hypothetical protein